MPIRPLRCAMLLATLILCAACGTAQTAYRPDPLSLAPLETPPQDDKRLYLDLIGQMQRQGAYFASLAHVDAYRQRYGDSPALRLLEADGLRETQQVDAARALYHRLANGPQGAAAWHGLGLIAARAGDAAEAENGLARAVQLQPLNTDYLGDLGFARLQAGRLDLARGPLARAAELAPGNVKANANLAVWALLRDDAGMAEQIMRSAALPATAREEVQRLAQQLRRPPSTSLPAHEVPPTRRQPPPPRTSVAAGTTPAARADARRAPSMLERFGGQDAATGSTP
ncbi:Flp pilus assembly protein TadD [Stenotrophomonas sp.]|uniref:Flp pilus assembly protein TadD n=1 Tax=Stenotrophomonas sp. TaxID=69392 RepID=UPI002FCA6177